MTFRRESTGDRLRRIIPLGVGSAPVCEADAELAALMAKQEILPVELADIHDELFGPIGELQVESFIVDRLGGVASHPPIETGSNVISMFGRR